jgi:protoporphyrinogen oxidase
LHKRSVKLGYFEGGFQALADALAEYVAGQGVEIKLSTSVRKVCPQAEGGLVVETEVETYSFDRVIFTGSPQLLSNLVPDLPEPYLAQLKQLKSMGAVVMTLALKQPLTKEHYWINLPKTDDFPFLALVEHTNFIDAKHYGGDHLIYLGDYLEPDHAYFSMSASRTRPRRAAD